MSLFMTPLFVVVLLRFMNNAVSKSRVIVLLLHKISRLLMNSFLLGMCLGVKLLCRNADLKAGLTEFSSSMGLTLDAEMHAWLILFLSVCSGIDCCCRCPWARCFTLPKSRSYVITSS